MLYYVYWNFNMIRLQVVGIHLSEVYDKLEYLRERNYKQGCDFDFAYYPGTWDAFVGETQKYTEFMFYDEAVAIWFMLVSDFKEVNVFKKWIIYMVHLNQG